MSVLKYIIRLGSRLGLPRLRSQKQTPRKRGLFFGDGRRTFPSATFAYNTHTRDFGAAVNPSLRLATIDDIPALTALIQSSARALAANDYTPVQIEAALKTAWGVDSALIRDGTYFVVEIGGEKAACGGWSHRKTLFGGDAQPGRESEILDPATEAARIRAFFVKPEFARQGLGRLLLNHCEAAARQAGFKRAALVATLPAI